MVSLVLGVAAFVLYLIYDINSFTCRFWPARYFFMAGTLLLGIATVLDIAAAWKLGAFSGVADIVLLAGACLSFLLMVYCLFFALPFEKTYVDQSEGRYVYSEGVYALCRHPGVLCFFGTYLLLGLAALPHRMILRGLLFSALNLGYAFFQDRVTFVKTLCDYPDYQKRVPFIIPTKASIRMARQTLFCSEKEENAL